MMQMIPRYHPQIGLGDAFQRGRGSESLLSDLWAGDRQLREGENLFLFNGATAALATALKALNLQPGSRVGVSAYACVTVFEAIAAAGLRCVFIDIDPTTFGLDIESLRQLAPQMQALVLIHMFGLAADVRDVRAIVGDKPIIEDCAHAMGSNDGANPVGFQGVAGVFSFNFHKPVSAGGGGILVVNDALAPRVQKLHRVMPVARGNLRNRVRKAMVSLCYRPRLYGLLVKSGRLDLRREGAMASEVVFERMSAIDRGVAATRIRRIASRFEQQRAWASHLCELARGLEPVNTFLRRGERWNGYLWPAVLKSRQQREDSLAFFHRRGVDAFVLWPESLRTASRFGYTSGQCPKLEETLPRLMMLPCYAELTPGQKSIMIAAVKEWMATKST